MVHAEIVAPEALNPADLAAWRRACVPDGAYDSPLLSPEFACAVARVRPDLKVAVYRAGADTLGFFAHHRRPGALARPVAAPLSDIHALVLTPGRSLCADAALERAGLSAIRFGALHDPAGVFGSAVRLTRPAYAIALDVPPAAFKERLRAANPKRAKNYRRIENKLEREVGPVRLAAGPEAESVLPTLLTWKSRQLVEAGLHDVFAAPWIRRLFAALRAETSPLRAQTVALFAGDRLVAGQFGVAQAGVFHPWIAAFDPDSFEYSPGHTLISRLIDAMPELGLRRIDLSTGADHYKAPYANRIIDLAEGHVRRGQAGRRRVIGGQGLIARLERRLDQIAAVELTSAGRLRGLAQAAAGARRRLTAGAAE